MYDQDNIMDMGERHHHDVHSWVSPMIAFVVGATIGAWLDNTRFGIWFNNSPVVNFIYKIVKTTFWLFVAYCAVLFIYFVITG